MYLILVIIKSNHRFNSNVFFRTAFQIRIFVKSPSMNKKPHKIYLNTSFLVCGTGVATFPIVPQ